MAGRFRQDLLYRLAVVEFRLPPLRERREDIPYLVATFVRDAAARLGKPLTGLAPDAEALLLSAPWHGHVRELQSVVERACLMAEGPVVSARDVAGTVPASAARDVRPVRRRRGRWPSAVHRRARSHRPGAAAGGRQQEGGRAHAGRQPPGVVSQAGTTGPLDDHQPAASFGRWPFQQRLRPTVSGARCRAQVATARTSRRACGPAFPGRRRRRRRRLTWPEPRG